MTELSEGMVERAARAIHSAQVLNVPQWDNLPRVSQEMFLRCGRAALEADLVKLLREAEMLRQEQIMSAGDHDDSYAYGRLDAAVTRFLSNIGASHE